MSALSLMNKIGEEVTWEFLKTEGLWYVWASHGGGEAQDNFKFCVSGKSLTGCIHALHDELLTDGPEWIRK